MTYRSNGARKSAGMAGFTLIELIIVVAIIGIIAAIAYPNYQRQVDQSRRADAQTTLLETAQRLERCYTETNSYQDCVDGGFPFDSENGHYTITAPTLEQTRFTLRATPQGVQGDRDAGFCSWFELTHTGQRRAEDGDGNDATEDCWSG